MTERWEKVKDDNGEVYWWSIETNETRWDEPPGFAAQEAAASIGTAKHMPPPPPKRAPAPHPPSASPGAAGRHLGGMVAAGSTMVKSNSMRLRNMMKKDEPKKEEPRKEAPAVPSIANGSEEKWDTRMRKKSFQAAYQAVQVVKNNLPGATPALDSSTLDGHIQLQARETNRDVKDVIRGVEISKPFDVKKELEVSFDAENIRFTGLPAGWAEEAHKQFGVPLHSCPRTTVDGYSDRIPMILVKLKARFAELGGMEADGIFRLAPDGQDVADAKLSINTGQALKSLEKTKDPHVVANLIKQFFRELKPKVLNVLTKEDITDMSGLKDIDEVGRRLQNLPDPQRSAFFWLLDLLCEVSDHQDVNRMTATNLAIVLSPNLFDAGPNVDPYAELLLSQRVAAFTTKALNWRMANRKAG